MKDCFLKSLGLAVPQVALGTAELGLPYGFGLDGETAQPSFAQAELLVHAALDLGIRFIDTARAYGDSEEILGRCLAGRRSELVLATKAAVHFHGTSDADVAAELDTSVEESLRLLRTDCIDWLMLHSATLEDVEAVPRVMSAVHRLREQGKIRAFGASIYNDALQRSLRTAEFECVQVAASVVDRRTERAMVDPRRCTQDFIVRSVLLRGALTEKYKTLPPSMEPLRSQIEEMDRIAAELGISLTNLAYRYAADFDGLILVGTASVAELEQAIGFMQRGSLSEDAIAAIRSMDDLDDRFLNPGRWPKSDSRMTPVRA